MEEDLSRGGPYAIDDRTGFKVRHGDTVREWTGRRVLPENADVRHPQDYVRGRIDAQNVPFVRPVNSRFVDENEVQPGDL